MADSAESTELFWVDPPKRGILPLETFHVPRRLARTILKQPYRVSFNQRFAEVIAACAKAPRKEGATWINRAIRDLYTETHCMGFAHSVEVWQQQTLVGGLYGIALGTAFFGESMFSQATDASKIALVYLAARLTQRGFTLLDAQFHNPHLEQFGLLEITRAQYHQRLRLALSGAAAFFADDAAASPAAAEAGDAFALVSAFLQSRTHTS